MKTLEFIFDFASPNAYLALKALGPVLERTGAQLVINPCLLGGIFKATNNAAPMIAFAEVKGKMAYERLEMQRFIVRHGLDRFRMNPHFPVNTVALQRGYIAADDADKPAYLQAGLAAMWEDGEPMGDPETIARVMSAAGLDGEALMARTQEPAVKQALIDNTEGAVARGVFGIPSFFVGDEMFFGKERIGQIEEALAG